MRKEPRTEGQVFVDLEALARSSGYVHAVAEICHRDNLVTYQGEMKSADMEKMFGRERLIRTEISTLIGLMTKAPLDLVIPSRTHLQSLVDRTDVLMEELHDALGAPAARSLLAIAKDGKGSEDIWNGEALREPIFYGSESAYSFQYRDLVTQSMVPTTHGLSRRSNSPSPRLNRQLEPLCNLTDEKSTRMFGDGKRTGSMPDSWLPAFEHSPEEIAFHSGVAAREVHAFLDAFTLQRKNCWRRPKTEPLMRVVPTQN